MFHKIVMTKGNFVCLHRPRVSYWARWMEMWEKEEYKLIF